MKTKPGQNALFEHVKNWITSNIDAPAGLRISGNLVRTYFRPGELGNPDQLTTRDAFQVWTESQDIELIYMESNDTYHLKQRQPVYPPPEETENVTPFRQQTRTA